MFRFLKNLITPNDSIWVMNYKARNMLYSLGYRYNEKSCKWCQTIKVSVFRAAFEESIVRTDSSIAKDKSEGYLCYDTRLMWSGYQLCAVKHIGAFSMPEEDE